MFQSRLLNALGSVGLIIIMGCAGDAGGCGCDMEPLPGGALPADQTIEGGMQVRVTRSGFDNIEGVARAVINDAVGDGFCVGRQGVSLGVGDAEACYENKCPGGARGCDVDIRVESMPMGALDNDTFRIDLTFDVNTVADLRLDSIFGEIASCDMNVNMDDGNVVIDVGFFIKPEDGELGIQLQNLDLNLSSLDTSNCGLVSTVIDFAVDFLSSSIGNFLVDLLIPVIDDLIQGFLPDPLGIEGMVDVGALIGSISPGTSATLETRIVPGGYVSLPSEGLSIGVITGFNADEDTSSRQPDLDSEPALCVPPFGPPSFGAAPHNLANTARNTFKLDAAAEFLGAPDPATDLAIGVSETFLDLTGHHAVTSGALCLGVGTELIPQLNLGLIGLLVPSLAELGSEAGDDPLLLVLRPTKPLDFSIGQGTEEDPNLTIRFENLDVDFYAYLFERFVRGFTITLTMDVGLNMEFTLDDQGQPAIEPTLVGLTADQIQLTVHNSEFLRESNATLEQVLPSIFDLALPLLSDGIGAITLPELAGFTLTDVTINKVTTPEDDFLALFASLVASDSMMARFGESAAPGGHLEAYIAEQRAAKLPPVTPADTSARLIGVSTPPPSELRAWMANAGGALPEARIALDGYDLEGRELEYSWRLNGGFWRPYVSGDELRIRERSMAIQGRHTIEVKARAVGQPRSIDRTPVKFEIVTDSAGPRILRSKTRLEGDFLIVEAHDLVLPDDTIEYAFGIGGDLSEPATEWMREGRLHEVEARALVSGGKLVVFARDEMGNVTAEDVDVTGIIYFHGKPPEGGGCACDASGAGGPSTGAILLALLALAGLGGRRRVALALRSPRLRRSLPLGLLVAATALNPACSCGNDTPAGPVCEIDQDCADACGENEIGICFEGDCLCSDDIPLGSIGKYSELALSSNGVAWVSAYNTRHGDLMVARWPDRGRIADEAWEFVDGVPEGPVVLPESDVRGGINAKGDDVGLYTSIDVAPGDVAMVSYFDASNNSLKFASNSGGSWTNHVVDNGTLQGDPELGYDVVGQYSSITARDDDGRPAIAYFVQIYDGAGTMRTELRFAAASTATPQSKADWTFWVVDEAAVAIDPDAADPLLVPEGVGLFVDATRAADGTPALIYYDRINGDLKLAVFDNTAGTFAAPIALAGADGSDVGWYPSISIGADGVIHASYLSATADDLMYVTTAEGAAPELVDDGRRIDGTTADGLPQPVFHFVGDDSSVVVTDTGPVIVYQDATTHELLLSQKNSAGNWEFQALAGDEDPFTGGYGFYADAEFDGTQVVISNWVIDQPAYDSWVEIHRHTVVVQ